MDQQTHADIGSTLKELRKKHNLTQEQLAEFLGVSFQAVSKWENNISYPDVSLLPILANFFQVTTDELLGVNINKRAEIINNLCLDAENLIKTEKYAEAVLTLRNALMRYPGNDQLMYKLALSLTGTIREHPENLEEAILLYLKILEISSDNELRLKAARDLMYRYYTKGENTLALHYGEQLPAFALCREYNLGRGNLMAGKDLAIYLKNNIQLFGKAMLECLEYFTHNRILSKEDAGDLTVQKAEQKMQLLMQVLQL
ncbi:MAG: helix-turn-helix domain-containing protein [Acetatifactor sp.]|nr:helix-turn-helix domain-containing protein [Acetatifactor sp.]